MKHWSIRVKITVMFAASLVVIVLATFLLVQLISASVLSKTAREYLLASVDANSDAVYYTDDPENAERDAESEGSDIRIEYGKGFLIIDKDFLDVINDVYTALYSEDGVLLYGMNPIARQMEGNAFTGMVVRRMRVDGTQYEIYEREITVYGADGLWLRGVMPLTTRAEQLTSIARTSAVLLPAMILLAVLYAHLTSGRMLKPLREIERTAAEISAGTDLNRRIAMTGPDDEVHRLADTFDDMIERLGDSFATERQFTSDASHELRTPMAVIMAQCEYTLDKERTVPEYVDALRTIRR
ncbi:MAG: HAMP domain-containing protein, partial [Butyrivibrio sp.]|nr:HAMP domain-containing protein [Butyrivibrio sp.]